LRLKSVGIKPAVSRFLLIFFNQGVSHEAFSTKGFYPDRIDDRCRDHRYFGCGGFACGSTCRTSITEVLQTGTGSLPAADGWGCESSQATSKYVAAVNTSAGAIITVTSANINNTLNGGSAYVGGGKMQIAACTNSTATTFASCSAPTALGAAVAVWLCGPTSGADKVDPKFLPGSCRAS
jgi:type IV pilus assembly protein PilA